MARRARRFLATEVVQTSTMDCGPAALTCLLGGYRRPVSYGRLREACQTDVDGTSIDTIEDVAGQLGLDVDQVLIPFDHVFVDRDAGLPALVVVRHADSATHFVVVWRRVGDWLQVMDPAAGRRWLRIDAFTSDMHRHESAVDARDWRSWTATREFRDALAKRMTALGAPSATSDTLIGRALVNAGWFPIGALDAAVRLVAGLVANDAVRRGDDAARLVTTLFERTCAASDDIHRAIPASYWSATPDATNTDATRERLRIRGAVLLRVRGLARHSQAMPDDAMPLSKELAAALAEPRVRPFAVAWRLLRADGVVAPSALGAAIAIAAAAVVVEALLFRGVFDVATFLALPSQRLVAALGLVAFLAIVFALEMPIVAEAMRHGRHLETRLRMALLAKLPRLNDRYFQSRPISDMADRGHGIHGSRQIPTLVLQGVQTACELVLTWIGIVVVAPDAALFATLLFGAAVAVPLSSQPLLNERDLRVRNHAGALGGFYLDALLGLVPIRTHRAERNVRRQHEGLLVEWVRAMHGWIRATLVVDALQFTLCAGLAGSLLLIHFVRAGGVGGADLLLVFWTLKLPSIGARLAVFAQQLPGQRNALLRLLEPLSAPEDEVATASPSSTARGVSIAIAGGRVVAGGHDILRDVDVSIAAGEHVAIVGVSGAGKSTLLGLLLGWHRLADGTVAVDGTPLDAGALDALRRETAWVDPAIQVWNRSLLDNLQFAANDADLAGLGAVLDAARLHAIVAKLPHGLQTLLGEGGALLSGGEGQRVRLARALAMAAPRLVLLDEPFRGLDRTQRRALLDETRHWWRDTTLVCVTHDVGETAAFDRVLVVEDGRVIEDGAPAALAARRSRYRALVDADAAVREALWGGDRWRRIAMHGPRSAQPDRIAA